MLVPSYCPWPCLLPAAALVSSYDAARLLPLRCCCLLLLAAACCCLLLLLLLLTVGCCVEQTQFVPGVTLPAFADLAKSFAKLPKTSQKY